MKNNDTSNRILQINERISINEKDDFEDEIKAKDIDAIDFELDEGGAQFAKMGKDGALPPHLQKLVDKIEKLPAKDKEKLFGSKKSPFIDRTPKGYGTNE